MAIGEDIAKDAGVGAVDEAVVKLLPAFNQIISAWLVSAEGAAESIPREVIAGAHGLLDRINGTRLEIEGTQFAVVLKVPVQEKS